ncbi:lipoprotein insertase outer membrane protein LolB [Veronia pacifica]|uniref:Outer-membrane lipoprotein LolB n=1 Tax=Veronia pacifica TaxID=1080227 RepID=A0A1C3EF50_9GAMM|nr:lipoprotein insertase outer membrane protein LolB [Veronia pacifica]ODA31861.1 outer membrane lipoprotein LolB [Veronia pacifica]
MFRPVFLSLISFCLLIVSGCTSLTKTSSGTWESHQAQLQTLNRFQLSGKVGFISLKQRVSANFVWKQDNQNIELRLYNFSGTLLTLNTTGKETRVTDKDGTTYFGADAQSLIKRLTGINLPLNNLPGWLKGLPGQNEDFILDSDEKVNTITSRQPGADWTLSYPSYTNTDDIVLPSRIRMNNDSQRVKIDISDWIL